MKKSLVAIALAGVFILLVVDNPFCAETSPVNEHTFAGADVISHDSALTTVTTETQTFTSIYSYTITSTSTTDTTTTTTITTATQTIVTVSTLTTSTTTTTTLSFWLTQTSTSTVSRTSTSLAFLTSLAAVTLTNTSTSLYPVVVTSISAAYRNTTIFSPTVAVTSTETSVIPTTSTVTTVQVTTMTTTTTLVITRPCAIASAAYGSELASQVQILREFRDWTVMSTFVGAQFMRIFNNFYYSFSPTVAHATLANPMIGFLVRALISPLIATLRVSSCVPPLLPTNSELTTLLGGILTSFLIGLIYVTPFIFLRIMRRETNRMRSTKWPRLWRTIARNEHRSKNQIRPMPNNIRE